MSKPAKLSDALKDAQNYLDIPQLMKAASFFDVVRYLVRQSLQVGVYTLFHVRFIYEAGRPMLYLTEGYTLAQKLGQSFDTGDAQESFARVLKVFATGSRSEEQLSLRDAVANMFPGVSAEDWVAAVSASQRQGIVLVPTDDIITRGSKIYKPATQFVVKHGLRNATFYLATNLEADVLYVLSTHKKIVKSDVSKGLYCLAFTHKCLALTWAYLAARLLAPIGSTGVIFNILKFMNEIVQEKDEVFRWMKNTTAVKARELVSKTSLDVIAGEGFNISRVDYSGPEPPLDEADPFLKNLVVALRHHHAVMAANPPSRLEVLISDLEFSSSLTYVPEKKAILVPTLYQNNPYLYPFRVPDFFNYGTLAVLIARVLIADVVGTGAGNAHQDSWDNVTRSNLAEVMSCLEERRASLGFGNLSSVSGARQKALILTLTMSVRLAYYALMKTFRLKAGTAKVFNDYWPAAEEVFFARFCLLWCSASNDANPLTPREQCMLPLYNMEEFVEHYSCKSRANFSTAAFCKV
ncbi:hypothetical protein HPB52_013273 [Rhipicephalus sanguineus]|uniref:Uncharacterized protein n=1 Tax=Rhipicephalus sanguineus TaxID=34632 RepID=A0A9D4T607_RHISA|nr:hypothetical protein HPB52_013273 [Rhipicephalus sanguineus]